MKKKATQPVLSAGLTRSNKHLDKLPEILSQVAYFRIWQICDCRKDGVNPLLPIGRTTWLDGVRSGKFPKPKKIGRTSCWAADDIKQLIIKLGQAA